LFKSSLVHITQTDEMLAKGQPTEEVIEEGLAENHQFKLAPGEIDLIVGRTRESLAKPISI
jgi:hypothetical protein